VAPRIVVIDDDFELREALTALLLTLGHDVEAFPSVDLAVQRYSKRRFDIALVDIGLPHLSGLKVIGQLRSLSGELGVVAFSAFNKLQQPAFDAGCDYFVPKPSVEELEGVLLAWPWSRPEVLSVKPCKVRPVSPGRR